MGSVELVFLSTQKNVKRRSGMSNMRHVILSAFAGIGLGLFAGGKFIGRQYEKHCELIEKQADRFSETSALMQQ